MVTGNHAVKTRVFGPIPQASRLLKGAGSGPGGQQTAGRLWFGDNRAGEEDRVFFSVCKSSIGESKGLSVYKLKFNDVF